MRICLVSVEIFAWGKYGGFGRATRLIGKELARRGISVTAVVPRRLDQRPVEELDGIRVLSFSPREIFRQGKLYQIADADIYHSMEPSLGTYFAMRAMPNRKHIVTFRDPRDYDDWRIEIRLPSLNSLQVISNLVYEDNWLVRRTVRRADGLYVSAHLLIKKCVEKYGLKSDPIFLPTPVPVPDHVQKAAEPTVCYLARLDRRKRPEIFFELAKAFPQVRFLVAGKSRDEHYEMQLRKKYASLSNLQMLGFVDQFKNEGLSGVLGPSWIMVNTAAREALPNAFLEAAAHGCAILSAVDPDGFASRFGYYAAQNDFVKGLEILLQNNLWEQCGMRGRDHIRQVFSLNRAIDNHLNIYEKLIGIPPADMN